MTVLDALDPNVITQDITVQLDNSGNASIATSDIDNGSTDNCSIASLSLDVTDFTCADLGSKTVTLTVTDQSGNSAVGTATVTVEDTIDPEITCPSGLTVETVGDYTIPDFVASGDVTVSDNCGFTVGQSIVPGTSVPDGEYLVEMTVTDDFGNTAFCSFNLKVEDTTLSDDDFGLSENSIVIYPNPVNQILNIKNNSTITLDRFEIYDVTGKMIYKQNIETIQNEIQVAFDDYAIGVYFVRISAGDSSITKRVIKR